MENNGGIEKLKKEDIGMLFSENFLPEFLTGYEYIKFFRDINAPQDIKSVEDYMEMMEFSKKDQNRLIKDYSHGMKSKISLITLFISRPKVLLLDEPLTSLDVVISTQIKKLLMELKSQGRISNPIIVLVFISFPFESFASIYYIFIFKSISNNLNTSRYSFSNWNRYSTRSC